MAHHITEFRLQLDLRAFLDTFWYSDDFYLRYLQHDLQDKEISIGEWTEPVGAAGGGVGSKVRHVQSQHPCKVSVANVTVQRRGTVYSALCDVCAIIVSHRLITHSSLLKLMILNMCVTCNTLYYSSVVLLTGVISR
jgi:hypothetical protein